MRIQKTLQEHSFPPTTIAFADQLTCICVISMDKLSVFCQCLSAFFVFFSKFEITYINHLSFIYCLVEDYTVS